MKKARRGLFPREGMGLNGDQKVGELISGFGHANFAQSGSRVRVLTFSYQEAHLCALRGCLICTINRHLGVKCGNLYSL